MTKTIYLSTKDHSVSGEIFDLEYNSESDLLKTIPQPPESQLGNYYQSEDYISHTDSKRTLFEKVYHWVRSFALKSKLNLIQPWKAANSRLLDIGAGTGDFLSEATKSGWQTTGFEPSESARKIALGKEVTLTDDLKNLPDSSFDAITMWHVLEHVPDVDVQILELKRLLKPTGILVIAVPNFKSYDAKIYGSFWAAYDVPRHLTHFSRQSISRLFANHHMELIKYKPMWFDAFYVSLLSEKYRSGSMKPIKSLFNGLISNIKGCFSGEFSSHIYLIRHKA
ncbi:class I SAM-dependent methyltransferase [Flavobacterium silvaticum]|uniref:Class I SAM-dependent methyltransferase n=1 Tax=Flavobacterium silvaticum TaxID=1852020 RepID=A0A972FNC2_9FLAO|nr:class I SAM-dependent methyltransferase [Flavobacterium silvaticum]NMH28420.1 class I SAM-dependent methyltransferase [Flavobacterium silvaticum]